MAFRGSWGPAGPNAGAAEEPRDALEKIREIVEARSRALAREHGAARPAHESPAGARGARSRGSWKKSKTHLSHEVAVGAPGA